MPRLGLYLVVIWFLSLFVFRTALQWWTTGATGVKGFSGAVGSLEWNAGLLASLGLAFGAMTPLAALLDWPGGNLLFSNSAVHRLGAFLVTVGILGALLAQVTMGNSWRIGVDETERTMLVTRGLFGWVRNPIFSFVMLSGAGLVLLVPNAAAIAAIAFTTIGIEIQVRAVEEPYLTHMHSSAYEEYCSSTGRFFPWIGRARGVGRKR